MKMHDFKQCMVRNTSLTLAAFFVLGMLSGCDVKQTVTNTINTVNNINEKLNLPTVPMVENTVQKAEELPPLPEDTIFRYYKSQLNEEEQRIYETVQKAVACRAESIDVQVKDLNRLLAIVGLVREDNPEYFWFTEGTKAVGYEKEGTYYITLHFEYNCTEAEQTRYQTEIDTISEDIINKLAPLSDYEKVKGVYEYIINRTTYDTNFTDQSCYTVLVHRRGVCAGYTNAANYLLHRLGMSTIYVSGTAKGEEHCWSLVKVNGSWYQLDVTWGDPVTESREEVITYTYFLTTDEDIYLDHALAQDQPKLPECRSTGCNYYVWQGRYIDGMDYEYISKMLTDAASRREILEFKCSNQKIYEAVMNYLVEENGIWTAMNFAHYYFPTFDEYQALYSFDDVHHIVRITPDYSLDS